SSAGGGHSGVPLSHEFIFDDLMSENLDNTDVVALAQRERELRALTGTELGVDEEGEVVAVGVGDGGIVG
ncbi:hypothetical protein Dimus_035710, partial [Dionaea muscipula]